MVAKRFTQKVSFGYEKIFAPVAKMIYVRMLIAIVSISQWNLSQLDVNNDFLNEDLKEKVYMSPPPGVSNHLWGFVD